MSQQINLINPALRPQRDWLSLPNVVLVVAVILLVEIGFYVSARVEQAGLAKQTAALADDSKRVQEQLLVLSKSLSDQRPDPALATQIEERTEALRATEQVLSALQTTNTSAQGFSGFFQGFSRQVMGGLWLTEIQVDAGGLSIRGRMQDANLLPAYIRRLNAEPTFQGRLFSALDMKHVAPPKVQTPSPPGTTADKPLPAYTEFTLQGVMPTAGGKP